MTHDTTSGQSTADSRLFNVTDYQARSVEGVLEHVPLADIELADNPRKDINLEGIHRLAGMLMRSGQFVPTIGRRIAENQVLIYAGQRRLLAARASAELAGTDGFEDLKPVSTLMVLLLDYTPAKADIRRIQAQENQREELSMADQQEQFRDCWEDRIGCDEDERLLAVCEDLGIAPKLARNLRRQMTLPDEVRARVARRPSGNQLSVTMANKLADMHTIAPQLTVAVAERITSSDLHDRALRDLGAFVHRTVVEDEDVYAVRIEDGALLDGHEQVEAARGHLTGEHITQVAGLLACDAEHVEKELDTLSARAKSKALKLRVGAQLRERAANGRYAFVHERGLDLAPSMWVVDPVFLIDVVQSELADADASTAREETFFGAAKVDDDDMNAAAEEERARKADERERQAKAASSNLGFGQDIAAKLMDPTSEQLDALRALICHLLVDHYHEVLAYGAGWTNRDRQQPVGDTQRYEPRAVETVVDAELQRALDDPDPLRGIAQLTSRFCAAFLLDPDGVTKTKTLGSERMARKFRDALPGGESPLRDALWQFMRPMMSPRLVELNKDAFVSDASIETTVDLVAHRGDSSLEDLDLGDDPIADAA